MFLSKLAIRLDSDRADWRDKNLVMMDGASYHVHEDVRKHMNTL